MEYAYHHRELRATLLALDRHDLTRPILEVALPREHLFPRNAGRGTVPGLRFVARVLLIEDEAVGVKGVDTHGLAGYRGAARAWWERGRGRGEREKHR